MEDSIGQMSEYGDTIAAQITAPGQAAIACVRVSGPATIEALRRLVPRAERVLRQARSLVYCAVEDILGDTPVVLDQALVSYFPGPKSFTGEDTVEFQVHGSSFVVSRLLENLFACGVRQAEAGEFSKRAFLNGRMDLSQVEGVADLIASETEAQARVAQQQLSGRLSNALLELGEPLRDVLAEIEAEIDFPEEDIEPLTQDAWRASLVELHEHTERYIRSFQSGKVFREGASVVLAGLPNVGKSSLLNALAGESRAIVTAIAGTTRDSIEQRLSIDGLAVNLWDTAGLVDAGEERDEVERLGIERSWNLLTAADLVVFLFSPDVSQAAQSAFFARVAKRSPRIVALLNKSDSIDISRCRNLQAEIAALIGSPPLLVSAATLDGIAEFQTVLREKLVGQSTPNDAVLICNRRHYEALLQADEALERAIMLLQSKDAQAEFISLELRTALAALQNIVGVTHTEDILGRIFSKFCIGK